MMFSVLLHIISKSFNKQLQAKAHLCCNVFSTLIVVINELDFFLEYFLNISTTKYKLGKSFVTFKVDNGKIKSEFSFQKWFRAMLIIQMPMQMSCKVTSCLMKINYRNCFGIKSKFSSFQIKEVNIQHDLIFSFDVVILLFDDCSLL
jgi:hypothetical protein